VDHAILGELKDKILRFAPEAGRLAEGSFAWEKALEYYRAYLGVLPEDSPRERLRAEIAIARIYQDLDRLEDGLKVSERILYRQEGLEDQERLSALTIRLRILVDLPRLEDAEDLIGYIKSSIPNWENYPEGICLYRVQCKMARMLEDHARVEELARTALELCQKMKDYYNMNFFENELGLSLLNRGRLDRAQKLYETAIERLLQQKDNAQLNSLAIFHANLGRVNLLLGRLNQAHKNLDNAIEIFKRTSAIRNLMLCNLIMAELLKMQGRYKDAVKIIDVVQRWSEITEDIVVKILIYIRKGSLCYELGGISSAMGSFEKAIELLEAKGNIFPSARLEIMAKLALLKAQEGRSQDALSLISRIDREFGKRFVEIHPYICAEIDIIKALLLTGMQELAMERITKLKQGYEEFLHQYKPLVAELSILEGDLQQAKGKRETALRLYREGAFLLKDISMSYLQISSLTKQGDLLLEMGKLRESEGVLDEAIKLRELLLGNIPAEYYQSLRTSFIIRRLGEVILKLHQKKMALPDYLPRLDRQLMLLEKMEALLENLLILEDLGIYKSLMLEGAVTLSDASGGILLLRKELDENLSTLYHILSVGELRIEFFLSAWIGIEPGMVNPSPQQMEIALQKDSTISEGRLIYIPLSISERKVGMIILVVEKGIDRPSEKVLKLFLSRAALMLDRLCFVKRLKEEYQKRQREVELAQARLGPRYTELELHFLKVGIVGHSKPMQRLYELISRASSLSVPILLQGETGTGKELVARAIHYFSPRRGRPFLAINCAAMPEAILDSELFGHIKGAFTGAERDRQGLFEASHTGTLFLDEIAEMSPLMQAKLLRVIEKGEIRPVGGTHPIRVDVRIITATNQNLRSLVEKGRFRGDLFYRLDVLPITLPPLRERKEDIPLLVNHFLGRMAEGILIDPDAIERLRSYSWPGNVRELENLLLQLVAQGKKRIRGSDIRFIDQEKSGIDFENLRGKTLKEIERLIEKNVLRDILRRILEESGWDVRTASSRLGVPRFTLYRRLRELGIKRP
jgi:transcriptional regulator with GAF, ATPase, and Fis domain